MPTQTVTFDGKPYVILPREEYDRLTTLAKAAELPPLPVADAQGNVPAVEYAKASLARKIIRDRVSAGLTQHSLAKKAGIRVETLCRIETGKHVPSVLTIDKIDRALRHANRAQTGQASKRKNRRA